jgi:hypothetical protein
VARYFARRLGVDPVQVRPAEASAVGLTAQDLPLHSTLDSSRARDLCSFVSPGFEDVADRYLGGVGVLIAEAMS